MTTPGLVDTRRRTWPDRTAWARNRRTAYADDIDRVLEEVSTAPSDYGSTEELASAADELRDQWRALGRDLVAANKAARAVFPWHASRDRRAADGLARADAYDALSPTDRAVVDHAVRLEDHRARVREVTDQLTDGRLRWWAISRVLKHLPADACPTWRAIIGRWIAVRRLAESVYVERVRRLPVDDEAWRAELRRRAEIERWRR